MVRFDLHLHSNYSDGSDSISELVERVKNSGIKLFSLTDHDTIEGCVEIKQYVPNDIEFIDGIELTCKTAGINSHILGYYCNPADSSLNSLINRGKLLRRQKLETRIDYLKYKWNIILTDDEKRWLFSRRSVVKTHVANILVKRGLAQDNVEAMKVYLDGCKTGNTKFDGEEAIETIKIAGGIPIWAHALGGEGEKHLGKSEFLEQLRVMMECGIQGLECYYSRYSMEEVNFLCDSAKKYNLFISGGSDYHGTNKTVKICCLNSDNVEIDSSSINVVKK